MGKAKIRNIHWPQFTTKSIPGLSFLTFIRTLVYIKSHLGKKKTPNHSVFPLLHFCLLNKDAQQQRNSKQYPFPNAKTKKPRWTDGDTNADWSHSTATTTFSKVGRECFYVAHTQLFPIMPTAVKRNSLLSSKVTLPNPLWKEQHLFI